MGDTQTVAENKNASSKENGEVADTPSSQHAADADVTDATTTTASSPPPAAAAYLVRATTAASSLPSQAGDDVSSEDAGYASSNESDPDYAQVLARFKEILALKQPSATSEPTETEGEEGEDKTREAVVLSSFDLEGIAQLIATGKARRIVVMCGAGISVNAGIPDFRSPNTGLYARLEEYGLPNPEAVFEIDFFRKNPRPFFHLAKELFPGNYAPTATHHFIRLLHDNGLLLRCYTQNIDSLEGITGLPHHKVIAAHGNFDSARCVDCRAEHEVEFVREALEAQKPCYCVNGRPSCRGLVKPDIVFFGESLPQRFWDCMAKDLPQTDLLIVAGTSLVVQPFASLIDRVADTTPRLLINKERVGETDPMLRAMGYRKGFNFGQGNYRDALFEGDCDEAVWGLCAMLGWEEALQRLIDEWKPPEYYLQRSASFPKWSFKGGDTMIQGEGGTRVRRAQSEKTTVKDRTNNEW